MVTMNFLDKRRLKRVFLSILLIISVWGMFTSDAMAQYSKRNSRGSGIPALTYELHSTNGSNPLNSNSDNFQGAIKNYTYYSSTCDVQSGYRDSQDDSEFHCYVDNEGNKPNFIIKEFRVSQANLLSQLNRNLVEYTFELPKAILGRRRDNNPITFLPHKFYQIKVGANNLDEETKQRYLHDLNFIIEQNILARFDRRTEIFSTLIQETNRARRIKLEQSVFEYNDEEDCEGTYVEDISPGAYLPGEVICAELIPNL